MKKIVKNIIIKYGAVIATFAFAFVALSANTGCVYPYYEPVEPKGIEKFKKIQQITV